jgi:hypothetical protein
MNTLQELLDLRFGDIGAVPETLAGNEAIRRLAGRGVVRRFKPEPLPVGVLDTLAAVALSSPSKSDLQQRDILIVEDAAIRARINALLKDQDWIPGCPHLLVFLGNNRRQRQVHAWRGHTFANDHLDAFFNATVDAAIALEAFVAAAEVPATPAFVSARLPLGLTVHRDRYTDATDEKVRAYDKRRNGIFPYRAQRNVARFGDAKEYGWSEDKARHYAVPEREDFGAYVKRRGFRLE